MPSPQKKNGYTAIANEIMEALAKYSIPGAQMQCLLFILRKTYGYHKKVDAISISQFERATGLDRKSVTRALNQLRDKKVIFTQKGRGKNATMLTSKHGFNKHYKNWIDRGNPAKKVGANLPHTKDTIQKIYTVNLKKFTGDFISHIKKTTPTKSPNSKNIYEKSLDTLEKLIRIDKFEEDYIFKVIRWAAKDDFWQSQVYSLAGLRKKNKSGLTKFQNLSISYDKEQPEEDKPKIPVFRVAEEDRC